MKKSSVLALLMIFLTINSSFALNTVFDSSENATEIKLAPTIKTNNEATVNATTVSSTNNAGASTSLKEQNNVLSPIMIKDLNSNDYLAYICNNNIIIRSIPNLIIQVLIEDLKGIYTIFTNINKTILYATNRYGTEIYVIKDEAKKAISHN